LIDPNFFLLISASSWFVEFELRFPPSCYAKLSYYIVFVFVGDYSYPFVSSGFEFLSSSIVVNLVGG
jgi:hypothetical protein